MLFRSYRKALPDPPSPAPPRNPDAGRETSRSHGGVAGAWVPTWCAGRDARAPEGHQAIATQDTKPPLFGVHIARREARMPAHVVVHFTLKDEDLWKASGQAAGPLVVAHGGKMVSRGPSEVPARLIVRPWSSSRPGPGAGPEPSPQSSGCDGRGHWSGLHWFRVPAPHSWFSDPLKIGRAHV